MARELQSPLAMLLLVLGVCAAAGAPATANEAAVLSLPLTPPPRHRARPSSLGALPVGPLPPVGSRVATTNTTTPTTALLPSSVCGASDLRASSVAAVCQLVASWRLVDRALATDDDALSTGVESWTCSAFRVGPKALATAGHCVFTKNANYMTQYAESIEVYCGAQASARVCASSDGGRPSARGARALASPRWVAGSTDVPSPFDWAVVETTKPLSGATLRLGAAVGAAARRARLTGFPNFTPAGEVGGGGACANPGFEDGCRQFSSAGTVSSSLLDPRAPGFLASSALDLCPGQSGGPVVEAASGDVLAVVSGFATDRCLNLFAAHAPEAEVNPATCERAAGGASVPCLWTRLTGQQLRPTRRGGRR